MGTRWKTQSLHSLCYPSSSSPPSTSTYTSTPASTSFSIASASTHSLPLRLTPNTLPSPSPLPSPPLSPPPLSSSPLGPASASVSVSASTSPNAVRFDTDSLAKPLLRPLSTPRPLSRLRSHSSSSLSRLRVLTPDLFTSTDPPHTTAAMTERPAIYVHFEFGVSWTPRHASKNRQVTYMSRSMRDRVTQFPRQLPPPNTNFLVDTQPQTEPPTQSQFSNLQSEQGALAQITQQSQFPRDVIAIHPPQSNVTYTHNQYQVPCPHQPPSPTQEWENLHPRRASRAQSRGSHERGRSAPPPMSNSPWDANPSGSITGAGASNLPRDQRSRVVPEVWKALPATPNQFRLGEDGMPWSSWTFPMGYADDENAENDENEDSRRQSDTFDAAETVPISPRRFEISDRDKGKEKEMQSLAAALVTVDNGFEDQWWYQGSRIVHVAGNIISAGSTCQTEGIVSTKGRDLANDTDEWAVLNQDGLNEEQRVERDRGSRFQSSWPAFQAQTPRSSIVDIVSPVSDFSSPMSGYRGLHRSLTTRSDELHM